MTSKPPKSKSLLEIDDSGLDEYKARLAIEQRESAERQRKQAEERHSVREVIQTTEPANAYWTKMHFLKPLFFVLLSYFCLSAFFDFVNFIAGVRILVHNFIQIPGAIVIYICINQGQKHLSNSQERSGPLWLRTKFIFRIFVFAGAGLLGLKILRAFWEMTAQKTASGIMWNFTFLYFAAVFSVFLLITWWLWKNRTKAAFKLYILQYGSDEEIKEHVREVPLEQIELTKFIAEGLIINLGILLFLQAAYGIDFPRLLLASLGQPGKILFCFYPFFCYVLFRKFLAGLSFL